MKSKRNLSLKEKASKIDALYSSGEEISPLFYIEGIGMADGKIKVETIFFKREIFFKGGLNGKIRKNGGDN
jgi:hypothetical protein